MLTVGKNGTAVTLPRTDTILLPLFLKSSFGTKIENTVSLPTSYKTMLSSQNISKKQGIRPQGFRHFS